MVISVVSSLIGVILTEKRTYSRHILGERNIPPSLPIQKKILEVAESML